MRKHGNGSASNQRPGLARCLLQARRVVMAVAATKHPAPAEGLCTARSWELTGEQRLAAAVLQHAVDDYLKYAAATDRRGRRLFADARRWVESAKKSNSYSFEAICDHLGLDADYLRRGLRAATVQVRCETLRAVTMEGVVGPPLRRRASNE
jgi:AraC-like DNA-binding protein